MDTIVKKKEKLPYVDMAKGIGIFMMVLCHADCGENPMCIALGNFALPLFFVISGMMLAYSDSWKEMTVWQGILKRIKGILVPFFIYSGVCIIYYSFMRVVFKEGRFLDILDILKSTVTFSGYDALWFLPTLFFGEVLFLVIAKYQKNMAIWGLVIAAVSFGVLYFLKYHEDMQFESWFFLLVKVLKALIAFVFITSGYLYMKYKHAFLEKYRKLALWGSVVIFIANLFLLQLNMRVDLNFCRINYLSMYYVFAIGSSITMLIILELTAVRWKPIEYYGKNSLIIMCTHNPLPILAYIQAFVLTLTFIPGRYTKDILAGVLTMIAEIAVIEIVKAFRKLKKSIKNRNQSDEKREKA